MIVTFNPDIEELRRLVSALRPQVRFGVIVDNGSREIAAIDDIASSFDLALLPCGENIGIAAAQNRGVAWALKRGATHVLLSDQDSIPASDMVARLLDSLRAAARQSRFFPPSATVIEGFASDDLRPVAAVGPVPTDGRSDSSEALVYSFTTWGARRREIPGPGDLLEVPFVLASGCLIPRDALLDVGPMNEALFIDHVDLAWCLRALSRGYRILVCGDAHLTHSLGEGKVTLPGGRQVHAQSPSRHYFMVRNTLLLLRASFLPLAWKMGYIAYLTRYIGFYSLLGVREPARFAYLGRGVRDGLLGRGGPARP